MYTYILGQTTQAYLRSDLDMFFANFSPPLVGSAPILDSIDGGIDQTVHQVCFLQSFASIPFSG